MPTLTFQHRFLFSALLILALMLGGCASSSGSRIDAEAPQAAPEAPAFEESVVNGSISRGEMGGSGITQGGLPEQRLVIRNASLMIVVEDPAASLDRISQLAEEMGGYVVTANLYQIQFDSGAEAPRASITIRVPAERLDEAIAQIEAESSRPPERRNIESQDVTREYTDLGSRLRNLENTEAQLTEIMENAYSTEDVLSVYNRLVEIREQIEVIKGQMQYYEQSAALSAISVDLLPDAAVQPLRIGTWEPVGVARDALQTLINTVQFLGDALIWILIYVLPVLLLVFVIFVLPIRLVIRAVKKRRTPQPPVQPAEPQAGG